MALTPQTITFEQPLDHLIADGPFGLVASSSSGLPIVFTLDDGPAYLFPNATCNLTHVAGNVTVTAHCEGASTTADGIFVPAAAATVQIDWEDEWFGGDASFGNGTIQIVFDGAGGATIEWLGTVNSTPEPNEFGVLLADGSYSANLVGAVSGAGPVALPYLAAVGLELVVWLKNVNGQYRTGPGARNPDGFVHAHISGDPIIVGYEPAVPLTRIFAVLAPGAQTITFPAIPSMLVSAAPFYVTATASSGLPVTYAITGPATMLDTLVVLTGTPGSVTITASQAGDATNLAATPVSRSFQVTALWVASGWLTIREPAIGLTDRSAYLSFASGASHTFTMQLRQRGQATVPLIVLAGDPYVPTLGCQVFLNDSTANGFVPVFAGTIDSIEIAWLGDAGDRMVTLNCVSLEQVFDTLLIAPRLYIDQTAGFIVRDLLGDVCAGVPVLAGRISEGAIIPSLLCDYDRVSDVFSRVATASAFVWGVDPVNQELYFHVPEADPSPFVVTSDAGLWESWNWKQDRADFRDRQIVRVSEDAFPHSGEFFVGAGQTVITLARAVKKVVAAYATTSTPNTAKGTFSGQPASGDTFTIGAYSVGWQPLHVFALDGLIVDRNGYVQKVTTAGTSGSTAPVWKQVTTETVIDGTVIWTCQGPSGLATGNQTYTFTNALDNTEFGQILIGATAGDTAWNTVQAINNADTGDGIWLRGFVYSLPTWENAFCNAIKFDLATRSFTIQSKKAGSGWIATLSSASAAFSWNAGATFNGTSPQTSLGKGYGATLALNVGVTGTIVTAPGITYTPGSATVLMVTPLNVGSNLNIEYTRIGGDVIIVEDVGLVAERAAIESGTGKYQQITSDTSQTSAAAGLLEARQTLNAFKVLPVTFRFETFRPGLAPGQLLTLTLASPGHDPANPGHAPVLVNGPAMWAIQEVDGEMIPKTPWLPGAGHYKYTVRVIDAAQIGDYLSFWEGLAGSGGGGGNSMLIGGSSGAAVFPLDFSRRTNSGRSFIALEDGAGGNDTTYELADFMDAQCAGCVFNGRFSGATFKNSTLTNATLTGVFDGCDFTNAHLDGATLAGSFKHCTFQNASMKGVIGQAATTFWSFSATAPNFTGSHFVNGNMHGCQMAGAVFTGCTFIDWSFAPGGDLKRATFAGVTFIRVAFDSCDLSGYPDPSSKDTFLSGCSFVLCQFNRTRFNGAIMKNCYFDQCALANTRDDQVAYPTDFSGANLAGSFFRETQGYSGTVLPAIFAGANLTGVQICDPVTGATDSEMPVKTVGGDYAPLPWDANKLLLFTGAGTLTLPSPPVSNTWQIAVQNASAGAMTLDARLLLIDGAAGVVTLAAGAGLRVFCDGVNYFTLR